MTIRISEVDEDGNLSADVRARFAANLGDPSTVEGAELSATIAVVGDERYGTVTWLLPSNGADDATMINTKLQSGKGGIVRGLPGETYLIAATVYAPANTLWDMTSCTVKAIDGWQGTPVQAECMKTMLLSPKSFTLTAATTGGTLAANTYYYSVSAVTASGETMGCPTKTVTTTGTTSKVTLTWAAPTVPAGGQAITGYRVYGRDRIGLNQLLASLNASTLSFADTGAAGTSASLPATNSTFDRTAGITIFGGTWDANGSNRPSTQDWVSDGGYAGHCIDLQHVDDLVIDGDPYILNATKWGIAIADFGHIRTNTLHFDTDSDGIHVLGPGLSWTNTATRATRSGDDILGLSLAEWPTYAVSRGSINKVLWNDLYAVNGHSFARVLGADGYKIGTLEIHGVYGEYSGQFRGGIYIWDNQDLKGWKNGTDIDKCIITDIDVTMTDSPTAPFPYGGNGAHAPVVIAGRHIKDITIERVTGKSSTANRLKGLIEFNSGSNADSTQTIDHAVVHQVSMADSDAAFGVVTVRGSTDITTLNVSQSSSSDTTGNTDVVKVFEANARVRNLIIDQSVANSVNGASGSLLELATGATIDRLTLRDIGTAGTYRLADIYSGTHLGVVVLDGISSTTVQELIRIATTDAVTVVAGALYLPLIPNAPVRARSGSSVTVLSRGGITLPSGRWVLYAEATPALLRITGADLTWQFGAGTLAPKSGDILYNTNSGVAGGVGLCAYDGTTWKNLQTGGTWVNA